MAKQTKKEREAEIDGIMEEFDEDDAAGGAPARGEEPEKVEPSTDEVPNPAPTNAVMYQVSTIRTKAHDTNTRGPLKEDDLADILPSIAEQGVLNPILLSAEDDGTFTVVTGTRRLAACKFLDQEEIPGIEVDGSVVNSEMISAAENLARKDLNCIEEARAYNVLIKSYKVAQADLARILGRSPADISRKLALLKLKKDIIKKLMSGELTEYDVRNMSSEGKGKGRGPKTMSFKIPEDDLPDGTGLTIKDNVATVTLRINIPDNPKDITKIIKKVAAEVISKLVPKKINSAIAAAKKV